MFAKRKPLGARVEQARMLPGKRPGLFSVPALSVTQEELEIYYFRKNAYLSAYRAWLDHCEVIEKKLRAGATIEPGIHTAEIPHNRLIVR